MSLVRYGIAIGIGLSATIGLALNSTVAVDCTQQHCAVVIDAGSSGSRIHWYVYDLDSKHYPTHIRDVYSKKVKPGLSAIAPDQPTVSAYLEQLMQDVTSSNIPVYVYATAGMRLLPQNTQNQYYNEIAQWFSAHPQWRLQDARTISGMEEGVYGWLSLNYHLGSLQDENKPLVGLLEVGGASAQIAFPIEGTTNLAPHDWVDIELYGRHLQIYAQSFLGLGINELFAHSQEHTACFPQGYPLKNGWLALGNAIQCKTEMHTMLQQEFQMNTVAEVLRQNVMPSWYTVSAVSSMVSQAPFIFSNQEFTGNSLLQQADTQYCQQNYQNLLSHYSDNEYLQKNCLLSAYFSAWLISLELNPEEAIHYTSDYDGSWTLGVLLGDL